MLRKIWTGFSLHNNLQCLVTGQMLLSPLALPRHTHKLIKTQITSSPNTHEEQFILSASVIHPLVSVSLSRGLIYCLAVSWTTLDTPMFAVPSLWILVILNLSDWINTKMRHVSKLSHLDWRLEFGFQNKIIIHERVGVLYIFFPLSYFVFQSLTFFPFNMRQRFLHCRFIQLHPLK